MIVDEIKKANIEALKRKDTISRGIFSVVLNKIKLEEIRKRETGENLTDADVCNILQKTIKELTEARDNYEKTGNVQMQKDISAQMGVIKQYLPQMMTKEEIKKILGELPDKSVPFVMKYFKANYNGKCDMKAVQEVLREI